MKAPITSEQAMQHPTVVETLKALYQLAEKLRVERDTLLDRVEEAEKDAARLDWLNLAGNRFAFYLSGTWYSRKDHGSPYRKQGSIRRAIDAAMEASK